MLYLLTTAFFQPIYHFFKLQRRNINLFLQLIHKGLIFWIQVIIWLLCIQTKSWRGKSMFYAFVLRCSGEKEVRQGRQLFGHWPNLDVMLKHSSASHEQACFLPGLHFTLTSPISRFKIIMISFKHWPTEANQLVLSHNSSLNENVLRYSLYHGQTIIPFTVFCAP